MFNVNNFNHSEGKFYWQPTSRIERAALALVQGRPFYQEGRVFYGSQEHIRAVQITAKYLYRIDAALDAYDRRVERWIRNRKPEVTEV